jgi:YHS domain-containing protein
MPKDPVCGMMVDETKASGKTEYEGKTYYFCALGCKVAFDKDPKGYLKEAKEEMRGMHGHH